MTRCERLETRRLFIAAAIDNSGILQITGTSGNDSVTLQTAGGGTVLDVNGLQTFTVADFHGINVDLGDGNDQFAAAEPFHLSATVNGGAGNDSLGANDGFETLIGGAGSDTFTSTSGGTAAITVDESGLSGNLTINSTGVTAGADHDTLVGSFSTLMSGAGDDTIDLRNVNSASSFQLSVLNAGAGKDTIYAGRVGTVYGGDDNDTIFGNDGSSNYGDAGDDEIHVGYQGFGYGGAGNDTIISAGTARAVDAGTGDDTVIYTNRSISISTDAYAMQFGQLTLKGTSSADQISVQPHSGGVYLDVVTNGDRVRFTGIKSIIVQAGAGDDQVAIDSRIAVPTDLYGGAGNDSLTGDSGGNRIYGEAGDDTLVGGSRADRIDGGDGDDNLYGYAGNDTLYGDAGDDRLFGGAGSDHLNGGSGTNVLRGEGDVDRIAYRTGDDVRGNGGDLLSLLA